MEIQFIGTGGAFDYKLGNSSAIVRCRNKTFLIDCGHTVYPKLRAHDLIQEIDYILLTHCHDDHIGSLSTTILHQQYQTRSPKKIQILVPDHSFKNEIAAFLSFSLVSPEAYVDFLPISIISGLTAINTTNLHVQGMTSFGFMFEDDQEILLYSGDIGNAQTIFEAIPPLTLKEVRVFHDMSFEAKDGIHTYYQTLAALLDRYQIYAYHLDPALAPSDNRVPLVANFPELLL